MVKKSKKSKKSNLKIPPSLSKFIRKPKYEGKKDKY